MIELDELSSFVVFADHMNFTHAADTLRISQPALHVKVRRLSEKYGVPLYRRVGRRLELTREGREVARFGREIGERVAGFGDELLTGADRQPAVLAAGEGSYLYLLGDALREFRRRSEAPLRLLTLNREDALDAVRSGRAHLGVAAMEAFPEDLLFTHLASVKLALILPRRHPLARAQQIRLRDLSGQRLIVPTIDRPHRVALEQALRTAGVRWEVAVEATGWELMIHFVKLGLGMAIVNDFCRIPAGLARRPLRGLPQSRYFVFHRPGLAERGPIRELKRRILGR